MAIAQIKNLQRRLANLESEATAALDRACGNNLWASIGPDAIDGLEDPAARAQANYYYGQLMTVRELQDVLGKVSLAEMLRRHAWHQSYRSADLALINR